LRAALAKGGKKMSDYLWDKTGEPDAETERLENLLGRLRFQPTPFDLPAELPAREQRAARPPRGVFTWPRLALAASLTLALLAGALLLMRQQTGVTDTAPQLATQNGQADAGEGHATAAAQQANGAANENDAGGGREGIGAPAVVRPQGGETRREERAAARPRPRLPDLADNAPGRLPRAAAPHSNRGESPSVAKRQDNLTAPHVEPERREETAQLRAEREAAEKVLYALRVTSEKLNYARRQVRESARGEDNR
jgi:hypothetical protein